MSQTTENVKAFSNTDLTHSLNHTAPTNHVNANTHSYTDDLKNDLKTIFLSTFKKEAARFAWLDFKPIVNATSTKPDVPLAKLLLQAGLFKLLSSNKAMNAAQWIFYNGRLLDSPSSEHLENNPISQKSHHDEHQHLTLTIHPLTTHQSKQKLVTGVDAETESNLIYLIHIHQSEDIPYASSPKISIVVEANAETTIMEYYINIGSKPNFLQTRTDIHLGKGSRMKHCVFTKSHCEEPQTTQITLQQDSHSDYQGFLSNSNIGLYKANVQLILAGEHAQSLFSYLLKTKKTEYSHIEITAHHTKPNCQSRIHARTVLEDNSYCNFIGKIIVDSTSENTDARLENKNLLLSQRAEAHTEPQLEIYNGNIQCSHGATVGFLDENALFYLQSRGITKTEAIEMLTQAFLEPIINHIPHEPLQTLLKN